MLHLKYVLLTLLIITADILPQQGIENKIKSGLDAYYNFDWTKGDRIFDILTEEYPENPAGYHYKSIKYLWFYLGSFNEAYLDTFFQISDQGLELAKKNESDTLTANLAFILSSLYANRSIANARNENYIYAVWESDRMKYYAAKALELNSKLFDAHLGLGLFNLAVSQIPLSIKWAIELVGVNADREAGIEHLAKTAKQGKLASVDALFYLSQIYSRTIIDYNQAESILKSLTNRYPSNLLFRLSLAWVEVEKGDLPKSVKKFKSIISSKEKNFPLLKSLSHYQIGNINYYQGNADSAIYHYNEYLRNNIRSDYVGITNLNIGLIYEMKGLRDSAISFYNNALEGNTDLDEDAFAKRRAKTLQSDSLTADQIKLIRFSNKINTGNYKSTADSIKKFLKDSVNTDIKAEAMLLLCESSLKLKKYNDAIQHAAAIMECKIENETWIYPFALYYGAMASFNLKKYMDAQLFLNLISDYSDFDFPLRLEALRYSLQRRLDRIESVESK